MRHYVGFWQIGSHIICSYKMYTKKLLKENEGSGECEQSIAKPGFIHI